MKEDCRRCWNAKTRIFRDVDEFRVWAETKTSYKRFAPIYKRILDKGNAKVYWCENVFDRRIFLSLDRPLHSGRKCMPDYGD